MPSDSSDKGITYRFILFFFIKQYYSPEMIFILMHDSTASQGRYSSSLFPSIFPLKDSSSALLAILPAIFTYFT